MTAEKWLYSIAVVLLAEMLSVVVMRSVAGMGSRWVGSRVLLLDLVTSAVYVVLTIPAQYVGDALPDCVVLTIVVGALALSRMVAITVLRRALFRTLPAARVYAGALLSLLSWPATCMAAFSVYFRDFSPAG